MAQADTFSSTTVSRAPVSQIVRLDGILKTSLILFSIVLGAYLLPFPAWWKVPFDSSYSDTVLLTLVVALFIRSAVNAPDPKARLFKIIIAVAFMFWLLVSFIYTFYNGGDTAQFTVVNDVLYLIYFIGMTVAIELRLDKTQDGPLVQQYAAAATGSALLLIAVYLYFGILPLLVLNQSYRTPYALYVFIDGYLMLRFALAVFQADKSSWRWMYIGLAIMFALNAAADLRSLAHRSDIIEYQAGELINVFWYAWYPVAMLLTGVQLGNDAEPRQFESGSRLSIATRALVAFNLSLPLIHVTGYALGLFNDAARQVRDFLVSAWILLFALLVYGIYFYFRKRVEDLDVQRMDAEKLAGQLEDRLNRELRMRSLGRLSAGLAHDFANTLTAISLSEGIIRDRIKLGKPVDKDLDGLAQSITYATDIVDKLRLFGNSGAQITTRKLSLNAEVGNTVELVRAALPTGVRLTLIEQKSDTAILAEPPMVHQVAVNFIYNAADAVEGSGEITVTISKINGTRHCASCDETFEGRYNVLTVTDTGPGIEPAMESQIFEPLVSTKPAGKGSGLGLSTVHVIMHSVGGHVGLVTHPNSGSRFEAYFPEADN